VGQKRLESAIASFNRDNPTMTLSTNADVEWMPYMIDPGTNVNGEEFEAYNRRRWGSSGWTKRLISMGKRDGANFEDWKWWPNTLKCHQLVALAKSHGISTHDANAAIFNAMYEEGANVSNSDVLATIAVDKLEIPKSFEDIKLYLDNNEGKKDVIKEISEGRKSFDISGVPFFVIGRTNSSRQPYGLSGAQDPATLRRVFENLMLEQK